MEENQTRMLETFRDQHFLQGYNRKVCAERWWGCWPRTNSVITFWWHPGLALLPYFNTVTPKWIEEFTQSLWWKGVGHWHVQWPYAQTSWSGVCVPILASVHFSPLLVPCDISQSHCSINTTPLFLRLKNYACFFPWPHLLMINLHHPYDINDDPHVNSSPAPPFQKP